MDNEEGLQVLLVPPVQDLTQETTYVMGQLDNLNIGYRISGLAGYRKCGGFLYFVLIACFEFTLNIFVFQDKQLRPIVGHSLANVMKNNEPAAY